MPRRNAGARTTAAIFGLIALHGFAEEPVPTGELLPRHPASTAVSSGTPAPDFRDSLAEVSKRQHVAVHWAGGPYRYQYDWGGGSAADPAEDEVARVASSIARELLFYPDGFLERIALSAVVLVRDLHVSEEGAGRGAAAYIFEDRLFLDVTAAARAIHAGARVRFVHHILWHRLDERSGLMWKDPEWVALNPPGFEYGVYSRGGVHETRSGAGSLSTQYPGFLNLYSTGNLPDDKAEVFAYLMVIPKWVRERAREDPFLSRKIAVIKARLAAVERGCDEVFWERVELASDDAIGYRAAPAGPLHPDYGALAFERLNLAIRVFPEQRRIEGDATLTFKAKSRMHSVNLALHPNFHVSAVHVDERELDAGDWSREADNIHVTLPMAVVAGGAVAVRVVYAGFPQIAANPPWQGGMIWSKTEHGEHWIGSSLWGGGCDLLWPCIDQPAQKPAEADLRFSVPLPLVAPANGVLMDVMQADGWRTYHWRARSPHTYGIVINAGPFALLESQYSSRFGNRIPMQYWYLPHQESRARELFHEFPRMLHFFESVIGPYPWADQKMGVVHVPYKGMEHQTINGYGNDYAKSPEGFDMLLQHEFSHEYFGNQMSVANYDDLWLHEGFATYMQMLYAEYLYGEAEYYPLLKSTRAQIRNLQPLVTGTARSQAEVYEQTDGPRADLYFKASLVLHTLRRLIGDEAFFTSVRRLVYGRSDPKPGNFGLQFRGTRDFIGIVNDVTGQDLDWFFDAYLYERDLPILDLERSGRTLRLTWRCKSGGHFPMPLELTVEGVAVMLPMTNNRGALTAREHTHVIVDPRASVLRQSDAIDGYQQNALPLIDSAGRRGNGH